MARRKPKRGRPRRRGRIPRRRAGYSFSNYVPSGGLSLAAQDHEIINLDNCDYLDSFVNSTGEHVLVRNAKTRVVMIGSSAFQVEFYFVVLPFGGVFTSPTECADTGTYDVRALFDAAIDTDYQIVKLGSGKSTTPYFDTDSLQYHMDVTVDTTRALRAYCRYRTNGVKFDLKPPYVSVVMIVTGATGLVYTYERFLTVSYDKRTATYLPAA